MVKRLLAALALLSSPVFAQDTVRFAAFGDYGTGPGTAPVAELVNNQAPDFIITVGDNCYGTTPIATQVGDHYGTWVAGSRFWPSLGNHEFEDACGGGSGASGYRAYFTLPNNERYYDIVIGPVHFFALNSNILKYEPDGRSASSVQGQWLKNKLATSTSPWQVVFFHHPPYSSGGGTTKIMRWPFEKWGVDAVLSGHAHDYERILKDANADGVKLPYFVTGLGGESISSFSGKVSGSAKRYNKDYGAMFITASSTALNFKFRNTSGTLIDSYSITKSATATTQSQKTTTPTQPEWKIPPPASPAERKQPRPLHP